jgi:tRNA(fMet)-specific endonuclease VapC
MALAKFLAPLQVAPYDDLAAQEYGRVRAYLEEQGTPIGSMDMLIAAHALSLGCTLITNNEGEFQRVPRLRVRNWAK